MSLQPSVAFSHLRPSVAGRSAFADKA